MKLNYHPETDSLYIDLSERPSSESKEISEGVVLDYDLDGRLVGIDIDNASNKVELKKLILNQLPGGKHSGKHLPAHLGSSNALLLGGLASGRGTLQNRLIGFISDS